MAMQCPMLNQSCILALHCSYCSFNTLLLSNLLNHFKTAHSTANCLFSLYQCGHCQLISTSSTLLTEHSLLSHNDKVSIQCIYQNHSSSPILSGEPMFECLLCSFKAKEVKNLTLHYFAFHGIKNAAPNLSKHLTYEYSTSSLYNTVDNKAMINSDKRNTFLDLNQEDELSSHTLGLDGDDRFSRDQLHRNSSQGTSHMLPYKCTHCGNAYNKRKYFAEHVISCSKALQLTCACGRVCKWRSNFYAHRKSCAVYKQLVNGGSHHSVFRRRGAAANKSGLSETLDSTGKISPISNENLLDMSTNSKESNSLCLIGTNTSGDLATTPTITDSNLQSGMDSAANVFRSHALQTDVNLNSVSYINTSSISSSSTTANRDLIPLVSTTYVSNGNIESGDLDQNISSNSLVSSASIIHALSQSSSNLSSLIDPNYRQARNATCDSSNSDSGSFIQCVSVKGEPLIMFPGM